MVFNGHYPELTHFTIAEKDIKAFLSYYRPEFPWASILPKMHILEDHTIPWMCRFHVGAGLMGEQGAESIHATMKTLDKTYHGIRNDVDKLTYMMTERSLGTAPSLLSLRPPVKKRKTKKGDSDDGDDTEEEEA